MALNDIIKEYRREFVTILLYENARWNEDRTHSDIVFDVEVTTFGRYKTDCVVFQKRTYEEAYDLYKLIINNTHFE